MTRCLPPDWNWRLDPDLDRTNRVGACHRRFVPRVPDWPTSALIALLSLPVYPFEGWLGEWLAGIDLMFEEISLALRGARVEAVGEHHGVTRADGESDESLRERVLDVMEAVDHER